MRFFRFIRKKKTLQSIAGIFFRKTGVVLLFGTYFLIGIFIYKDYGTAWDEPFQDNIGLVNLNYILKGDKTLISPLYSDRDHGPIYEIALVGVGRMIGVYDHDFMPEGRPAIFFRHFVNFCTYFTGVVFFYLLCRKRFKSTNIALIGTTFLVLSPRLFADSFYNSKDTVGLAFYVMTIYCFTKYFEKKTIKRLFALTLTTAVTIDIRIAAVFILGFFILFFIGDFIFVQHGKNKFFNKESLFLLLYFLFTIGIVIVLWPFLWTNSLHNFIYAWSSSVHYVQDVKNLYLGGIAYATHLPWHYIPVWILISTPPLYILLFFVGLISFFSAARQGLKRFYVSRKEDILYCLWFFTPIIMTFLVHSTLYNAWRHLFFVYPAFLLIALGGVVAVKIFIQKHGYNPYILKILGTLLIFNLVYIAAVMIKEHPYQNLYFNALAGRDMNTVRKNFETDYWGLSYRKGLEYIVEHDKSSTISLMTEMPPGRYNAVFLQPKDRARLKYVDDLKDNPKYYLTAFFSSRNEPPFTEIYSVKMRGARIMSVYKL